MPGYSGWIPPIVPAETRRVAGAVPASCISVVRNAQSEVTSLQLAKRYNQLAQPDTLSLPSPATGVPSHSLGVDQMEKNCAACGSTRFRISRLRVSDVPQLLILRYPIRCKACHKRTYASMSWVMGYKHRLAKQKQAAGDAGQV